MLCVCVYITHTVEEASLGAELEPVKDGKVVAVNSPEATGLRAEDVGPCGVSNVLFKPHGAESLLQAIITAALAARVFPLGLLQLLAASLLLLLLT